MSAFLHRFGALWFYLLGVSYCIAFLLWRNQFLGDLPAWWMQIADLPLLFAAVLYGGTSVYRSLTHHAEHASRGLAVTVGLPLTALFLAFVVLNFWS